ncbi:MAG: hypothetical protein NC916_01405 [Candidatus Omnitrophica bacterium]|nr:hypothetical protein [Candidatus Omnitrophota bacterium]
MIIFKTIINFYKKFNKREKILSIIILILLLLLFLKFLIFNPVINKLRRLKDDIDRLELAVRKYLTIEQEKDIILAGQKRINKYLDLKGSDEEKMALILSKIEEEARKANLSILDMNPGSRLGSTAVAIYSVQLRAEADLENLFDFVYNLENADILFKIEKLNLAAKDESGKILKIEASILGISL